tara:strand:+ start:1104 stop:2123 length:1020 start_codon:yes stop_codon:yes gene_type:complete
MADYYNYNNISLKVNGSGILANSASLSFSNELVKSTRINRAGGDNYIATNGQNGSLSLSYYVDANSGDPFYMADAKPGQNVFSIDMGGMTIQSGYLNSYSWNASPHGILQVSANFNFYEDLAGTFSPTILPDQNWDWYKMSDLTISLEGMDVTSKVAGVSYNESHSFTPVYNISGVAPVEQRYGEKIKSLSLETYNIVEAIPYTGKQISVDIGIRGQSTLWSVNGTLQSKEISINFGEKVVSTLDIEENGYGSAPTITNTAPGPVSTLSLLTIQGTNLDQATAVYFHNGIRTNDFRERSSTQIKVKVPRFAQSGPVKVVTPYGEVFSSNITIQSKIDIP